MKKFVVGGLIVIGSLYAFAGAGQAAEHDRRERYDTNARAECILPWYRFFGACDEAIDDYPYGNKWHDWNNRHRHGRYGR